MGRYRLGGSDLRLCNGIQDEKHVLFNCSKTENERGRYGVDEGVSEVGELTDEMDVHELVSFVHECMKHFK